MFAIYIALCYVPLDSLNNDWRLQGFSLRASVAAVMFFVLIIFYQIFHYYHRRARTDGYLQFYAKTREVCVFFLFLFLLLLHFY